MKSSDEKSERLTLEHLGRLQRRAEILRERIAARAGERSSTPEEMGELASVEAAISIVEASRWRRASDEPIAADASEILAVAVDQEGTTLLLRRTTAGRWRCECGCDRAVDAERIIRWRPIDGIVPAKEVASPTVSPASYRGRKRLAIIEDRIQYLTNRATDLKQVGKASRFEKDELEALDWIRNLALRSSS